MSDPARRLALALRAPDHQQPINPKAVYRTRDVALFEEAASLIERQAALLSRLEWSASTPDLACCPLCSQKMDHGHLPDCPFQGLAGTGDLVPASTLQERRPQSLSGVAETPSGFPLSDAEHAQIKAMIAALPELVVAAAVRADGVVVMVERPGRHGICINYLHWLKQPHDEHGFITSHGRFVDRLEGGRIACAAGQTTPRDQCNGHLFSEDVWNDWDVFPETPIRPEEVFGTPEGGSQTPLASDGEGFSEGEMPTALKDLHHPLTTVGATPSGEES